MTRGAPAFHPRLDDIPTLCHLRWIRVSICLTICCVTAGVDIVKSMIRAACLSLPANVEGSNYDYVSVALGMSIAA